MVTFPKRQIVLASASPRRLALLRQLGLKPLVCPAETAEYEDPATCGGPSGLVTANAAQKAGAVAQLYPNALVIAADTVVVFQGRLLGKPVDEAAAAEMLGCLSGRIHHVYTGICLLDGMLGRQAAGAARTDVWFHTLSAAEISRYVAGGSPLDKAGAYGIQDEGGWFVRQIAGDYTTVVGLSFSLLWNLLAELQD